MDIFKRKNDNKLYIAGGGQYGEIVARYLKEKGISYSGVVDKRKKEFMGTTTITYDELDKTADYIVASLDYEYGIDIKEELVARGVNSDNIYSIDKPEIIQDFFDVLYDYSEKFAPKIKELKDKYKGEMCFIVGNGPSLRIEDLDKLTGKHCFATNGIYQMYSHTRWRPEFYFSQDSLFVRDFLARDLEKVMDSDVIFTSINSKMIDFNQKYNNIRYMRLYYEEDDCGLPKFSTDCDKIINLSCTVTYSMLQMAVYMGFQTIYLIGMDCSFFYEQLEDGTVICNDNVKDYGDIIEELYKEVPEDTKGEKGVWAAERYQHIKGFKAAKKFAENNNIKIYNATRGGKLEVFERVDFDSLF
jgi:hypothetical protein